ncbi:hypothetical protein C8R45DRAFT_1041377 [Mycena sanguinolenta]|nr:hypothetical protein C8R45DRAFT_1041377 [Mycena sanguinolenta]
MVSSVSSEPGITISKRRNRLKSDIVEALRILKCLIHRDLLSRVPEALDPEQDGQPPEKDGSWDIFVDEDPDDYELPINTDA